MKISESIQKLLPFGYLYLVIMGILKESVFYYKIGINILEYSTIMDILISPIATLTEHPIILIGVIICIVLLYSFVTFLSKHRYNKWVQRLSSLNNIKELNDVEIGNHFKNLSIKFLALGLLSFFLGIGLGNGVGLSKKIMNDKLEYNHKLNYNSGDAEQIYLINSNSLYYFYLTKGSKNVKISPIGAVKNIELTNNKMLK